MTSPRARRLAVVFAILTAVGFSITAIPTTAATTPPAASNTDSGGIRAQEWPLDDQHFDAAKVWALSQGTGITVAVLDTGVDSTHPDLLGQVLPGTGFVGDHSDTGQSDISSDSHGTSIAAIIAGTGHGDNGQGMTGLAPKATILPIRISLDSSIEPVALAEGIRYAVDHHAQIITISDGTPDPNPTIAAAITYALNHNTIVVAAAGNNGQQGNPAEYPASFPGVINVTGIDTTNTFWPQSEAGPTTTLAAPAVNIYSATDNGHYLTGNGTSYAAPYVAATAALLWSAHPHLTATQVTHQLTTTATPEGDRPHDNHYGYGILNPLNALATPIGSTTPHSASASTGDDNALITIIGAIVVVLIAAGIGVVLARRRRQRSTPTPPTTTKPRPGPSSTRPRRPASQRAARSKK